MHMNKLTLIELEDILWDSLGDNLSPKFAFLGKSPLLQEAFLRIAAISHPYFGRAKFAVLSSESAQFEAQFKKMAVAESLGLLSLEIAKSNEELCRGAILICDQESAIKGYSGLCFCLLDHPSNLDASIAPNDPYRRGFAALSQIGSPLDSFCLPKEPARGPLQRDWHYLGPCRDQKAYHAIQDELLLGLKKNEGTLCPKESYDTILACLRGEDVPGKELYRAIKECYRSPCLLRDMASYQHDTWILRTLAFNEDVSAKAPLLVPYPTLLATELAKLESLLPEESFSKDILYSDYLIPLTYLRSLL